MAGDDEIDWGEDTSDAAVKARQEAELSGATKNIVISDDLEKSAQERVDMFYSFVKVSFGLFCHILGCSSICWLLASMSRACRVIGSLYVLQFLIHSTFCTCSYSSYLVIIVTHSEREFGRCIHLLQAKM